MRLLSVLLFVAGLAIALLGPLVWLGRLPVVLGAVCVLVAALLAAREGQRIWLAAGGLVLAVVVFLAPGLVNGWRNGRGIAWEVPDGEVVELAASGYAITSQTADLRRTEPTTLVGLDIDSGARRWRTALGRPQEPVGDVTVEHVGQTLLVVDRDGALYALDLRTGSKRWSTPPAARTFPEIADAQTVAMLRCDERDRCTAEARALADGAVRWSAPADFDNSFLGAPRLTRDASVAPPVWPASFVIVHVLPDGRRYEARDLETGRVLASGNAKRTATASIGDVFLRADDKTLTATNIRSGRELWRHPTEGAEPVRTVDFSSGMIAVLDGGVLLARETYKMPDLDPGDPLQILDPRSGKVTEHPVGVSGYVDLFGTGTANAGVPLVRKFGESEQDKDQLVVDGRHYARERLDPGEIAATTTQAAFKSTLSVYGLGKRRGIEVYDRRGGRVARLVAVNAHVHSAGERLVISVGDHEDDRRSYVVRGR
jgi:PQQ-like domain